MNDGTFPACTASEAPVMVRRPLDRAEGAALDAIECIRAARIGDARDLLREALLDLDTAERRQREEAARG